jgi:hypothetical protein
VCSQTLEKKAVTIAMMTSLSNASFIYTPYLFKKSDEPRYTTAVSTLSLSEFGRPTLCLDVFAGSDQRKTGKADGQMAAMAGFSLGGILVAWTMRYILKRQNKNIGNSGAVTKYPY